MTKSDFGKLLKSKKNFIASVYITLIVQMMITFFIVYEFRNHPKLSNATKQSFWLYLLLTLGLILILSLLKMPIWMKLVLFSLFSIVNGAMLHHASRFIPAEVITQALIGTTMVFALMTVFAFVLAALGVDLSFLGLFLLGALIGLLVASIVVLFIRNVRNSKLYKGLLVFGLVLFSIYVVFFTNVMLQKDYNDDFVGAAIDLYLSFINIFVRLLSFDSN